MRELVEHIRTVHFALVLVSCVLTATAVSRSTRSLDQALRDASAILTLNTTAARQEIASAMEKEGATIQTVRQLVPAAEARVARLRTPLPRQAPPRRNPGDPAVAPGATMSLNARAFPAEGDWAGLTQYEPWIALRQGTTVFASPYPGWLYLRRRDAGEPTPLSGRSARSLDRKKDEGDGSRLVKIPSWDTLAEFIRYWDGVPTLVETPVVLADGFGRTTSCGDDSEQRTFEVTPPQPATEMLLYRTDWDDREQKMWVESVLRLDMFVEVLDCVFDRNEARYLDARAVLVKALRAANPDQSGSVLARGSSLAPFSVAFSDLDSQTTNLKNMILTDLVEELLRRSDEAQGSLEIIGATFPAGIIGWVGATAVVGCLLYLLMHLNELLARLTRSPEMLSAGYIGVYQHWLPRVVSGVTLIVMPATAIALVLTQQRGAIPFVPPLASATAAVCGFACMRQLVAISRITDAHPMVKEQEAARTTEQVESEERV